MFRRIGLLLLCFVIFGVVACNNSDEDTPRKRKGESRAKDSTDIIGTSSPEEAIRLMLQAYQNNDAQAFDELFLDIDEKAFNSIYSDMLGWYHQWLLDPEESDIWDGIFTGTNKSADPRGWNLTEEKLITRDSRLMCIKSAMETEYARDPFPRDDIAVFTATEILDGSFDGDGSGYITYKNLKANKDAFISSTDEMYVDVLMGMFEHFMSAIEKAYGVSVDDAAFFMGVVVRDNNGENYSTPAVHDEILVFCVDGNWCFEWASLVIQKP